MGRKGEMIAGLSNAQYQKWQGLSVSKIKELSKSPMHLRYRMDNPQEPTPAMQIGTVFHAAVLEPETLSDVVAVAPDVDRRTKDGKAAWAEFEQDAAGKIILKQAEMEQISDMAEAVEAHPEAMWLLADVNNPLTEVSCFWTDFRSFGCKCRPDRLTADGIVIDLKTTDDASPDGFARACAQYKYHWQAAWYLTGLTAASGYQHDDFRLIAVEKKPPYGVGVYQMPRVYIDIAREQIAPLLDLYRRCLEDNSWPGYSDKTEILQMPVWALKIGDEK